MKTYFLLLLIVGWVPGQPTVESLVDSVSARFAAIEDYSVRIKLKVELPKFRMPRKTINLYFKQPDKLKVEADGFAIVPRQGLNVAAVLDSLTDIRFLPADSVAEFRCWQVAGERQQGDRTLISTVWIDRDEFVIRRVKTRMDTLDVMTVNIEYEQVEKKYYMPVRTVVDLQISPAAIAAMEHSHQDRRRSPPSEQAEDIPTGGQMIMEFSRYRINRGIKDRVFKDSDR